MSTRTIRAHQDCTVTLNDGRRVRLRCANPYNLPETEAAALVAKGYAGFTRTLTDAQCREFDIYHQRHYASMPIALPLKRVKRRPS